MHKQGETQGRSTNLLKPPTPVTLMAQNYVQAFFYMLLTLQIISTSTMLVGQQEGHPTCKNSCDGDLVAVM